MKRHGHRRDGRAGQGRTPSSWLDAALAIGTDLACKAEWDGRHPGWSGEDLGGHDNATAHVVRGDVGPGLYGGAAGIGWFLAHLGACAGVPALVRVGLAALAGAVAESRAGLEAGKVSPGEAGADLSLYGGAGGIALAALQAAGLLERPGLRGEAVALARAVAARTLAGDLPAEADLIGGSAGIVVALSGIHRLAPEPCLVEACRAACEHLVRTRHVEPVGVSWPGPHGGPALCGLGHGASGIAWALHEGARLAGEPRFAEAAAAALAYERSWFDPASPGWPDLREPPPDEDATPWPGSMAAWCHGALGIGALRWHLYQQCGDMASLAEAGAGMYAARAVAVQARHSVDGGIACDATLCHGLGGVIELLLLAFEVSGQEEHMRAARHVGKLSLDIFHANGGNWTTGLTGTKDVPGLMVGLAGIGVTLLRLHDPGAIACPLLPGRVVPGRCSGSAHVETGASGSA